uniref:Uncharacterized protein n=1 Tax=viral metagenome TaxID=1070528 RepID=A0A6C0CP50_9ZZZZ
MEIPLTSNLKKNINKMIDNPDLFKKEYEEQILLGYDGYYKENNDHYILYKENLDFKLNLGYLENYDLLINKLDNRKKVNILKIPFNHRKIIKKTIMISNEKKANTFFTIDIVNNKINDFYFYSSLNEDNFNLKTEIRSFLSRLK